MITVGCAVTRSGVPTQILMNVTSPEVTIAVRLRMLIVLILLGATTVPVTVDTLPPRMEMAVKVFDDISEACSYT